MERAVVFLGESHKQKLAQLARSMHCSAAEIHRKAIECYTPTEYSEDDLKKALVLLRQSHQNAIKAIKQAEADIAKTITYLKTTGKAV